MADQTPADKQKRRELWKSALFRWLVFAQLLVLFGLAYVRIGELLIFQTNNTNEQMHGGDQMHNMSLATLTRDDLHPDFTKGFTTPLKNLFPHRADGVVMPLWPWMTAWLVEPGHKITEDNVANNLSTTDQDRTLFNKGRKMHVGITLGFLIMLGIAACRIFSFPAACNLVLLGGLGAFLPRAAYFQPEPVYFMFFFLTWLACVSALNRNSLWIYGLIGVLSGIAYMAKSSVQPLLLVFIGVSSLRCAWEFFSAQRRGFRLQPANQWHWRNHLVGLVFLGAGHLMTIGPRMTDAYENFGDMFHSYPAYWMWMDDFKQSYDWMGKHNTRPLLDAMRSQSNKDALAEMLKEHGIEPRQVETEGSEELRKRTADVYMLLANDRPSFSNYWRAHTGEQMWRRLRDGTWNRVSEFLWPRQTKRSEKIENQKPWKGILEWRGIYLGWLALTLVALLVVMLSAAPKAEHAGHVVFRHGSVTTILFVLGTTAIYFLAYGWYAPIARGSGDRFTLSLYLPLVFSFVWGAESIVRRLRRRHVSVWIMRGYLAAQWILFGAVCWRLVEILRSPHFYNG